MNGGRICELQLPAFQPAAVVAAPTPSGIVREGFRDIVLGVEDSWVWLTGSPADVAVWCIDRNLGANVLGCLRRRSYAVLPEYLGLDYGLVAYLSENQRLFLSRGGIGRPKIYWRTGAGNLIVSRDLRSLDPADLSREGIVAFLATAAVPGPYDVNHTEQTVFRHCRRVPRSAVIEFQLDTGAWQRRDYDLGDDPALEGANIDSLAEALRDAVDARLTRITCGRRVALELSGGIDSGIVAGRLAFLPSAGAFVCGVASCYPYREFRCERNYMDAVAASANVPLIVVDGSQHLTFSGLSDVPLHDEPSRAVAGYRLFQALLEAGQREDVEVIINGTGGDQLFANDPSRRGTLIGRPRSRSHLLSGRLHSRWRDEIEQIRAHLEDGDERGDRHFFSGLMHYEGWVDRHVAPRVSLRRETGLVDRDTLRGSLALHHRQTAHPRLSKGFARSVFASCLPDTVRVRQGKVSADGLHLRGLRSNLSHLSALIEAERGFLLDLGIKVDRVLGSLQAMASGEVSGEKLIQTILAFVIWKTRWERAA